MGVFGYIPLILNPGIGELKSIIAPSDHWDEWEHMRLRMIMDTRFCSLYPPSLVCIAVWSGKWVSYRITKGMGASMRRQ